jgi:hypothetical protein
MSFLRKTRACCLPIFGIVEGVHESMVHEIFVGDVEAFLSSLKSQGDALWAKFSTWNGYRGGLVSAGGSAGR